MTLAELDLRHHGDAELAPGLIDLAVNVRAGGAPPWLRAALADSLADLAAYPDAGPARAAVAARHQRPVGEVLLTSGAAEFFVLLARALRPQCAVVVHPQFTEPEAALRAAGHPVRRVVLRWPFTLDAAAVPAAADLVVVGNPTNPTSVLHPAGALTSLARPGRTLVIDEAFADCVPGEPESLAARRDLPGLVVVRSLTKTWGVAGLRIGYGLADAAVIERLSAAQPLWAVSTPALVAATACSGNDARAEVNRWARHLADDRTHLAALLAGIPGVDVVPGAAASFLLLRTAGRADAREALRRRGFAVRRGDTFPGLGPDWFRAAVRDPDTSTRFAEALTEVLA